MLVGGVRIADWEAEIFTAWLDEGHLGNIREPLFIAQELEGETDV